MKFRWIRKPIPTPITLDTVYEHTPLDPWRGEHPRFIRPVRDECQWQWAKLCEDGQIVAASDLPSNARHKRETPDE